MMQPAGLSSHLNTGTCWRGRSAPMLWGWNAAACGGLTTLAKVEGFGSLLWGDLPSIEHYFHDDTVCSVEPRELDKQRSITSAVGRCASSGAALPLHTSGVSWSSLNEFDFCFLSAAVLCFISTECTLQMWVCCMRHSSGSLLDIWRGLRRMSVRARGRVWWVDE